MNKSIDFESWLRFKLPKLLYLSESKSRNMAIYFQKFADTLRILESANPKAFHLFIDEFQERILKVAKRKPRKAYPQEAVNALSKDGYVFSKNRKKIIKRPR